MATSSSFHLLDDRIQRFLWAERWEELREIQELATPEVLAADRDVLLAAATASGKTEAAFLPALTYLLQQPSPGLIIYISPLKALINDQFGRLERLCEHLEIPVWSWHGDVQAAAKRRFRERPTGVLLITPESIEAMLCRRGTSIATMFRHLSYLVVDELHCFIGSERGKQLQSIMHRIELAIGRKVARLGLSATLGDLRLAAKFLRSDRLVAIVDASSGNAEIKIAVKGFEEPLPPPGPKETSREDLATAPTAIAVQLFRVMLGTNNLVFPNSRREVERYTLLLNQQCEFAGVPNAFWPHHGSLSKEIRLDTETALRRGDRPATAVCTSTLELGIDIGAVKSVVQIGPPPSVASLRQRLGRSGRRGEPAILRGYVIEQALDAQSPLSARLRLDTVRMVATLSLLLERWFEPPAAHGAHLSTLVQQLLSLLAERGGLRANDVYAILCGPAAPFAGLPKDAFVELLRHLGKEELLMQDAAGLLLHGRVGEAHVNHYGFYAAFASEEEFRIMAQGKTIGTLPIVQMLNLGQRIVFGGRTWVVEAIDDARKTIEVAASKGGAPPLFNTAGGRVHTQVRQRMRAIYASQGPVAYLDSAAQSFLDEGRVAFAQYGLGERWFVGHGRTGLIVTWLGDAANEALACLLQLQGVEAHINQIGVECNLEDMTEDDLGQRLSQMADQPVPSAQDLLADSHNLLRQKWDWALPPRLLRESYASLYLDLETATEWLRCLASVRSTEPLDC